MSGSLNEALLFLINTLFDLYLFVLCVRFILAWSSANYFNPITRVIIQVTQPVISPLRRFIPNVGRIECSTFVFILFLEMIKVFLLTWLAFGGASFLIILLTSLLNTIKLFLNTFFYAIIIFAIMSWISLNPSPLRQVLTQLSSPILRPCQRFVPTIGGLDISPIFALIALQFFMILL